jgi:hypothetical protein
MRRIVYLFIWLALSPLFRTTALADAPLVGDMGASDRLDITGAHYVAPERLRAALDRDLDFLLAADPATTLDEFLAVISRRLVAGYHRAGFATAAVSARPNLQTRRVSVVINEGPRFTTGAVRLVGRAPCRPEELAHWLAAPPRAASDHQRTIWQLPDGTIISDSLAEQPLWSPRGPARFNAWSRRQLLRQLHLALAERGFFFPVLKLDALPAGGTGSATAELVVEVVEPGPPGLIGPIEVQGAKRNSPAAILRYLDLASGQAIDRGRLAALQAKLYESARFARSDVVPELPEQPGAPLKLVLKLVEVPEAPPIGQPLSAEEEALVRLRGWIVTQVAAGQQDLVLSLRDASDGVRAAKLVLSARGAVGRLEVSDPGRVVNRGMLQKLRAWSGVAKEPPDEHTECLVGLEMTPAAIAFYSPLRDRKFAMAPGEKQLGLRLTLNVDPRDPRRLAIGFDPKLRTSDTGQRQPVALETDLAPAAFVALAHLHEASPRVEQGVLHIKTKQLLLESDAASGRLLRFAAYDKKKMQSATLAAAPGQLQRAAETLRRLTTDDRNDYDARRPNGSLTAFAACELAYLTRAWEGESLVTDKRGLDVWQGLLAAFFLPDLDAPEGDAANDYFIPAEPSSPDHPPRDERAMWAAAGPLRWCRQIFSAESWPYRLSRSAVLHFAGRDREARRELTLVDGSAQTGPLGYLSATLMSMMVEPTMTARLATHGQEKLELADFRRDYALVLESRHPWVQSALAGLKRFSELDAEQIDAAVRVLPSPLAGFVSDLARRLHSVPDGPTDVVLAGLLDEYWEGGLRLQASFVLRWLSESSAPATAKAKGKTRK